MAVAKVRKEVVIELDLSREEAEYLKNLLQNHLGSGEEPRDHYDLRSELFTTFQTALKRV